ncbi:MAG: choice-of-anchor I family protein [Planctomycetota bacterium]
MRKCLRESLAVLAAGCVTFPAAAQLGLTPIGSYGTGVFDESSAEIPAFDPLTDQLFVVNADRGVDILDLSDPFAPTLLGTIADPGVNSVAVSNGRLAVAVADDPATNPGRVEVFSTTALLADPTAAALNTFNVGALPDMLTFTPDGTTILVANEGEPNNYNTPGSIDPVGSVSIIDLNTSTVSTAGFSAFNTPGPNIDPEVRVFGPGASVQQDLEPEYIAIDSTGSTAYVALQENNAVAVVDIATATVQEVRSLGFKDHRQVVNAFGGNNPFDASNRDFPGNNDGLINLANWPVFGMYQPDAITTYEAGGRTYLLTANEGDARDYDDFSEEVRVGDLTLDPTAFPNAAFLQDDDNLGRLRVTDQLGDTDGDGDFDELYAYGARSFSVFDVTDGTPTLVYDSGNEFEVLTALSLPAHFNSNNDDNDSFDSRSDDKGPEPEAIIIGEVDGTDYAFIGLERIGGVMVYDLSDPLAPEFVEYVNPRDFSLDLETAVEAAVGTITADIGAVDSGPEGFAFIGAGDSPIGVPLLVVANEVSGTTTIYAIPEPTSAAALMGLATLAITRRRVR